MLDLHSHILWGIDDGATSLETSISMVELASKSGSSGIVATPHIIELNNHLPWSKICSMVNDLQKQQHQIKLYPGAEVMISWNILKIYDQAPGAYCINGSRYALIELPMYHIPDTTEDILYELRLMGKVPILAHPERYPALWSNPERMLAWMKKGMLLQINGGSLLGFFGEAAKKNAQRLVKNKIVSFIGSDAHGMDHRSTDLSTCRAELANLAGEEYAKNICDNWPKMVINNQEIHMDIPSHIMPLARPSILCSIKKAIWG